MARMHSPHTLRLAWAPVLLVMICAGAALADGPRKTAVFDFELIDTSLEGEMRGVDPAERKRLGLISGLLRRLLARSDAYVVVSTAPARADIEDAGYLYGCNGCEADIARALGADVALRGTVQKVSNLILNVNLYVVDATSGERLRTLSVDIRGNTDTSWSRGVRYLVRNHLLAQ